MSPRTKQQYQEIRELRKNHIMDISCELFANHGFYDTSISMIAKKAGISKGLIYNYFDSKETLLRELVISGLSSFHKSFDPNHDGILTMNELEFYISEYFNRLQENRDFWKMYFAIIAQPPVLALLEEDMRAIGNPMSSTLINYFKDLGYEDPVTQMELFAAVLSGIAIKYVSSPEQFHLNKLKVKVLELFTRKNSDHYENT